MCRSGRGVGARGERTGAGNTTRRQAGGLPADRPRPRGPPVCRIHAKVSAVAIMGTAYRPVTGGARDRRAPSRPHQDAGCRRRSSAQRRHRGGRSDRGRLRHGDRPPWLACTGGLISSTGVAGLTLGGGIGWLQRRYGLACDNLRAAQIVTADAEIVDADESLLWGLRGGGGNFGIVTRFEFGLHEVSTVFAGLLMFPVERGAEVLRTFRDWAATAPEEASLLAAVNTAPPEPFVPAELVGKPVVVISSAAGAVIPLRARPRSPRSGRSGPRSTCSGRCPTWRAGHAGRDRACRAAQLLPRRLPRRPH